MLYSLSLFLSLSLSLSLPPSPPPSLSHTGLHDETDKALKEAVHSRLIDQAKLEALQAEQRELARSLREAQQARFTAVLQLLYYGFTTVLQRFYYCVRGLLRDCIR